MSQQHVAILLCTYNGEKYVREQVESIIAQTHRDWSLWVSDDGSKDRTLDIIRECMQSCRQPLHILRGPSIGFSQNFMSLLSKNAICADYFAFADQDDIWHADKLERALRWHVSVPEEMPNLYGGRTHLVDEAGESIGYSPFYSKKPCFANALVQNIASGNTMVLNRKARELLCLFKEKTDVAFHDWWAYILISGVGGNVHYDPVSSIDYRQHSNNLVGMNMDWGKRFLRFGKLMQGQFHERTEQHLHLLEQVKYLLIPENRVVYEYFKRIKYNHLPGRIISITSSRIFRQTFLGQIELLIAVLFKKV